MKSFRLLTTALILFICSVNAQAQGGFGASYEKRSDEPSEGIGLRFERGINDANGLLYVSVLTHASFFSRVATLKSRTIENLLYADSELNTYDVGVALKVAANVPVVTPYVAAGIGFENFKIEIFNKRLPPIGDDREQTVLVNGSLGVQWRIGQIIRPFAEVRFNKNFKDYTFEKTFEDLEAAKNRVAVGIVLQF
jgi:hypothetical protein